MELQGAPQEPPRSSQKLPRSPQELPRSPQEQGPGSPRGRRLVGNRLWWPLKPFRASESCACCGGKLPPRGPFQIPNYSGGTLLSCFSKMRLSLCT